MKIKPVMTEKSLMMVKKGQYTFWIPVNLSKNQARKAISELFGVTVMNINTLRYKIGEKKSGKQTKTIKARKKAIVTLATDQSIDLFGEEKKKTKKKKK